MVYHQLPFATSLLSKFDYSFKFQIFNAENIPYPDNSFDCVIANHMLYHMPDVPQTIKEIHRVLNNSGKLYAATNGKNHMYELLHIIRSVLPSYPGFPDGFTLENGIEYLKTNFSDIKIKKHANSLYITNYMDLQEYVHSMGSLKDTSIDDFDKIDNTIKEIFVKNDNAITIQKDAGLFIAQV